MPRRDHCPAGHIAIGKTSDFHISEESAYNSCVTSFVKRRMPRRHDEIAGVLNCCGNLALFHNDFIDMITLLKYKLPPVSQIREVFLLI
jgi:hypothetical protein